MKTFRELCMMTETIECNKLSKHFKFSGTIEENENGLNLVRRLIDSDCVSLLDLLSCLEQLSSNFCKTGNMTRILDKDKRIICRGLSDLRTSLIEEINFKGCNK